MPLIGIRLCLAVELLLLPPAPLLLLLLAPRQRGGAAQMLVRGGSSTRPRWPSSICPRCCCSGLSGGEGRRHEGALRVVEQIWLLSMELERDRQVVPSELEELPSTNCIQASELAQHCELPAKRAGRSAIR